MFNPEVPCDGVSVLLFIFLKIIIVKPEISKWGLKKYIKYITPPAALSPVPPCKHPTQKHRILWILVAIKPGSLYYFLSLSCSSSVWQEGGQGSESSGTKWRRGSLWQVLMTASGRQKLRFYSLTECLPGPSSLRELWLTPSWEEASPDASINTIRSHQKDDPLLLPRKCCHYCTKLHQAKELLNRCDRWVLSCC